MFIEGCIVMMDIDLLEEKVREKGLTEYRPNIATGYLTRFVEELARKHNGVIVYGIDYKRGTEEAVIEFPLKSCIELIEDLKKLEEGFEDIGMSISVVCRDGLVIGKIAKNKREAFRGTPWRDSTYRALRTMKKRHHRELRGDY